MILVTCYIEVCIVGVSLCTKATLETRRITLGVVNFSMKFYQTKLTRNIKFSTNITLMKTSLIRD